MVSTSALIAALAASATALQVNWYNDDNCGSYQDTTYFQGKGIHGNEVNNAPAGAGSALFVTTNGCQIYGCSEPTGGCTPVDTYTCIAYPQGTYVSSDC